MSQAEKHALELRDLAVQVAKAKGVVTALDQSTYHDARLRIEYSSGSRKRSTYTDAASLI